MHAALRYKDTVKTILKKCDLEPAQLGTAAADRNKWCNVCRTGVANLQLQLDQAAEERGKPAQLRHRQRWILLSSALHADANAAPAMACSLLRHRRTHPNT